jgi:hypothetical protein
VFNYCRFADAAAFAWSSTAGVTAQVGALARPFVGTINIDPATPTFAVTGSVGLGDWVTQVDRIGRTTGWSGGSIFRRCVSWANNNGIVNLCQNEANITVDGGDSGGPVFVRNPNGTARIEGLVVGRYRAGLFGSQGWKMVYSRFVSIEPSLPFGPLIVTP